MSVQFVKLYNSSTEEQKAKYLKDVLSGLSMTPKEIPEEYLYDEEGSKLFAQMNFTKEYYLANCERDIFTKHGSELLGAIGKEKFNFIDLGAGDADKTKILIRKGLEEGFDFNYIPVDISEDSNNVLVHNIKGISDKLNMFVVTAKFEEGIKWITENVKHKNAFFMVGSTIGCFEKQAAFEYFKWLGGFLKKGDMIIMGFDMKKDPKLIQNAYFGNPHEFEFIKNSIRRINKDLGGNFNLDAFYPHSYFNPEEGVERGCLVSREDQTVKIAGEEFHFKQYEVIRICKSRKWLQSQIDELMDVAGAKKIASFMDQNKYFKELVYRKEE